MKLTKSKIDRAGQALAKGRCNSEEKPVELEAVFDQDRKAHLQPLTECTLELQHWLTDYGTKYYIAQRLKRKLRTLRKLNRLSVRLTQFQDIDGCRIIVSDNRAVDRLWKFLEEKMTPA
ncbi:hypothetical protein [Sulfuritortus calidifontis]|uniref:hypothetical protein n=1 Tax=Sulfuritortus calidifontis TaxID=1914471 RepID=UPI000F84D901|nr:hypothetical protein [Sulfuritortus calidifontis]